MNLILSDVEETIMIVDQVEGALEAQATVNVSSPICGMLSYPNNFCS